MDKTVSKEERKCILDILSSDELVNELNDPGNFYTPTTLWRKYTQNQEDLSSIFLMSTLNWDIPFIFSSCNLGF